MPNTLLKRWRLIAVSLILVGAPSPPLTEEERFVAGIRYTAEAGCPVEERAGLEGLLFRCTDGALGIRIEAYKAEHFGRTGEHLTLFSSQRIPEGTQVVFVHESVAIMEYGIDVGE